MFDRPDLQLMVCEQVMGMDTEGLPDLLSDLPGSDLLMYGEEKDLIVGEIESLDIDHPPSLDTWLGFMLYSLGERLASQ